MTLPLPLFPLDAILYPGTRSALHIFEPRYRAMLADILTSDHEFGLLPPGDDGGAPAPGTIGCVARVEAHQSLADDRSLISVVGRTRFVLQEMVDTETPYLLGTVAEFDDDPDERDLPPDAEEALRRLGERCRNALAELTDAGTSGPWAADGATLTFEVASVMPWDAAQARQLLAMRSAAGRADVLLRVLPQLVPELEGRAAVHSRASTNGKGPHTPDIAS
ncbi:MAG: LON peptidase substrate-binding domain-containing protein [Gemmatimonadales bacterium]|nr:LON peptidase substrate-binding domain-containing protein [Gemmatimonadales bacterium]